MSFFFNVKGEPDFNPGGMYWYNSSINEIQNIYNEEELKYVALIYKETTGIEAKTYMWDTRAPVYRRVFGTLVPGAKSKEVIKLLERIKEELGRAVD